MNLFSRNYEKVMQAEPGTEVTDGRSGYFWNLTAFNGGLTWVGKWKGHSPWEKHNDGDEFLFVASGTVEVLVKRLHGKQSVLVNEGCVFVVPKGLWHKQIAKSEVIVLGATPGVTIHSSVEPVIK